MNVQGIVDVLGDAMSVTAPVMRFDREHDPVAIIDLTSANPFLQKINVDSETEFTDFIFGTISSHGALYGAGGYGEVRVVYQRSEVFEGDRSVHLGVDLWASAGEEVYTPLDGRIHSFRNNDRHGDYGPTLILEHQLHDLTFFTLYGHLSRASLHNKQNGDFIPAGERIGWLGDYSENVHWPPHLHFQVITDLLGNEGDFPGVARPSEADYFLSLCPDPNLILRINALNNH